MSRRTAKRQRFYRWQRNLRKMEQWYLETRAQAELVQWDLVVHGSAWSKNGNRISPADVYIVHTDPYEFYR